MQKLIVRSGAQTGVDQAGLDAALELGLSTRCYMPEGFLTQDGPKPEFAEKYGAIELGKGYPQRTVQNVKDSDVTIRIASDWQSAGEKLTLRAINELSKPHFNIDIIKYSNGNESVKDYTHGSVAAFLMWKRPVDKDEFVINFAGNSEKTSPGIYSSAKNLIYQCLGAYLFLLYHKFDPKLVNYENFASIRRAKNVLGIG